MNIKAIGMTLAALAYPPGVYYGMKTMSAPQSAALAPQSITIPRDAIDIPRDAAPPKDCGGGVLVPASMPCPAPVSGIGRLTGRFIAPQVATEPLTIYGDSGSNPAMVIDRQGIVNITRGLNADLIASGGEALIMGRKWLGDTVGLSCTVTRKDAEKKSTISCGTSTADVFDGAAGSSGNPGQGCSVTKAGTTATISCPTGTVTISDGSAGAPGQGCSVVKAGTTATISCPSGTTTINDGSPGGAGRDCSGDPACIQRVKDAVLAEADMRTIIDIGKKVFQDSNRFANAQSVCVVGERFRTVGYYTTTGIITFRSECIDCTTAGLNYPVQPAQRCTSSPGGG